MLRRLTIENYGLIERAEILFGSGATMFTGETGSGKTMVLGAIGFCLGERAGVDMVRRGAARAQVILEFDPDEAVRARFDADGFTADADEHATLSREIAQGGKSAARLNGRPVTAAYVREVAPLIADMVGQHEAQRLLAPAYHVELLDKFGGEKSIAASEAVAQAFARYRESAQRLAAFESGQKQSREQFAFAQFALGEIRGGAVEDGEDERLVQRRRVLDNAEKIALALQTAQNALIGDEGSASDALGAAGAAMDQIRDLGPQFTQIGLQIQALQSEANDLAAQVAREAEGLEFDPAELEAINARLEVLDGLKRKYGGTLAAVLQSAQEYAQTIDALENKDEHRRKLERGVAAAGDELTTQCEQLSALRHAAAKRLKSAVEGEMQDLALPSARFDVAFRKLDAPGVSGDEEIEFLFAANKGEQPKRLGKGASGGELSRVLLALVVAVADARGSTALVFDEIDAGIGGATATAVGVRLGRLAQHAQVICVTHLAQIASWAGAHYSLEKREGKSGTSIAVTAIARRKERAVEIARMLSGESHDVALEHARLLLEQARA